MPIAELHLLAIDPGGVSGWAHFIIPRNCMFGDEDTSIIDWGTGSVYGSEEDQSLELARLVRQIQGLSYKLGPAVVVESFDYGSPLRDPEVYSPVRIGAQLKLLHRMRMMDDARLVFQSRTMAKRTFNDDRLRHRGYWVPNSEDHERDATRHALTALRRAKDKRAVREKLWDKRWANSW